MLCPRSLTAGAAMLACTMIGAALSESVLLLAGGVDELPYSGIIPRWLSHSMRNAG